MNTKTYESQVLHWREKKYNDLVRENSWLALSGLYWLNDGKNLVGSNPTCEVILPERAPGVLGVIEKTGKMIRFNAVAGVKVKVNGRSAQKAILKSTSDANPTYITWNETLRFVLHGHDGNPAIRIWDNEQRERFTLPPLKWFPINKRFRIPATYTRYKKSMVMEHPDTFGEMVDDHIDGYLSFRFEGKTYKLDASETSDRKLFIKFRDDTSKKETYPPSRYCYTQKVVGGKVTLDFNYSYSPPCAFTPYATCIFAPPQNALPFRVEAGEIYKD